jgi:hypothetical protein
MQAWEAEFRSIHGISHGEWCLKTASERAQAAKEECGDKFRSGPFLTREGCMFALSECPRPLLSLPPEGWDRLITTFDSVRAYLVDRGPAHAFWIGITGLLPPLVALAFAVYFVAPFAQWVLAGLRD